MSQSGTSLKWAGISSSLAVGAILLQTLYGKWHWEYVDLRRRHESTWLSWGIIDSLHAAAFLMALAALVCSVPAITRGHVWIGVVACLFALLTCAYAMLIA